MAIVKKKLDAGNYNLKDQVVNINRVTKVVKGGKNMSFAALVVIGDPATGVVGYGSGKGSIIFEAMAWLAGSCTRSAVKTRSILTLSIGKRLRRCRFEEPVPKSSTTV